MMSVQDEYKFYGIKFEEYVPNIDTKKCLFVPNFWLKQRKAEKLTGYVAYPKNESTSSIKLRIRKRSEIPKIRRKHYAAKVIFGVDSFEAAELECKKYNESGMTDTDDRLVSSLKIKTQHPQNVRSKATKNIKEATLKTATKRSAQPDIDIETKRSKVDNTAKKFQKTCRLLQDTPIGRSNDMSPIAYLAAALLAASCARADNCTTADFADTCGLEPEGPWSAALEDWVTAERVTVGRHGRIMALPPTQGYYVSERIDLMPPPPPPPHQHGPHHMLHRGPYPMHHPPGHRGSPVDHGPPETQNSRLQNPPPGAPAQLHQGSAPQPYDEWQATPPPPPGAGKIVNKPPNPYKDQFKPSYPPPSPPARPIPVQGLADRVDEARPPPHKQVSETDLYLLGAIEKLVYRVDLMEKRLRKMEENVHYLVAGTPAKPEPCPGNFTRLGGSCYHVSSDALNWKNANYACRKLRGHLLELEGDERRRLTAAVLTDPALKGFDFWTGGLNPGLLWIWSHSAKAVANTTGTNGTATDAATVVGEGRCLALVHDAAAATYVYRGQDCALRHRYVCEREDDATRLGNEIERVARDLRARTRIPKMKWANEDLP